MNDEREAKLGSPISITGIVNNIANIGLRAGVPTLQEEAALAKRITVESGGLIYEIDLDVDFAKDIRIGDKLILNHLYLLDKKILMPNESSVIAKALVNTKEEPSIKARLLASRVKHVFGLAAASYGLHLKIHEISVRHDIKTKGYAIGIYTTPLTLSFLNELHFQLAARFASMTSDELMVLGLEAQSMTAIREPDKNIVSIWFMIDQYNPDKSEKVTFTFDGQLNTITSE